MRIPSSKRQTWALRRQRFTTLRELRESGVKRAKRHRQAAKRASEAAPLRRRVPARLRYYATREQRREVEQFFDNVNEGLALGKQVVIDFSRCERLYPCGVLILMGWVDDWVGRFPRQLSALYPKDDLVEQMLQHVGVLQKLGLSARKVVSHQDVIRWHYFHGRNADATPIEPFMLDLQQLLGEERQLGLGNCVTEAMINVRHHAYEGDKGGPWWIFATVSKGWVFVALHDRGDSVPGTLLAKPALSDFLRLSMWMDGRGDDKLITAAVGGRTRTKLPYRGKGLPEMLEFTKSLPSSELGIFSRHGFFRYNGIESAGRLTSPINGTLVIWMIKVREESGE